MKKTAYLMILAVMALTLAACSKQEETAAAETEAATGAAETAADQAESETTGTTDIDTINEMIAALEAVEPDSLGTIEKLGEYKGIALTATEHVTKTDEDVMDYLETTILPNFTEDVTDAIKEGDTANIDYEGKKDGVAFDGGTAEGYDLKIGSGSFIDGFESGLIGHKAGETVDLNLTFPENYTAEELAGQDVIFTVKINSVKRQQALSDEIAQQVSEECKTVDELKAYVKEYLQAEQDLNERQNLYYDAVTAVLENSEATPTDDAITYTVNSYIKNYAESVQNSYGIDIGTMLSYYGASLEDFMESYQEYAVDSVKQRIVLREIAKNENLKVTDADIEAFADAYGYSVENLKSTVGEDLVNELVLEDLANKFIVENAQITYTAAEEE